MRLRRLLDSCMRILMAGRKSAHRKPRKRMSTTASLHPPSVFGHTKGLGNDGVRQNSIHNVTTQTPADFRDPTWSPRQSRKHDQIQKRQINQKRCHATHRRWQQQMTLSFICFLQNSFLAVASRCARIDRHTTTR